MWGVRLEIGELSISNADICEWEFSTQYHFISAWDSIWHVPLHKQDLVLRKLRNTLDNHGVIIFTSGAVDEAGDGSSRFIRQKLYHAALGVPTLLNILADCNCVCRHLENDDWPNQHLYIFAQKRL